MIWQDLAILVVGCINAFFLIPTLRSKFKPPLETSVPITLTTAVKAGVLSTLELYASTCIYGLTTILWGILVYQKWHLKRKAKQKKKKENLTIDSYPRSLI